MIKQTASCCTVILSCLLLVAQNVPAQDATGQSDRNGTERRQRYELLRVPQTPEELWDAAKFMFRVGQLEQARDFLVQLLKAKVPPELLRQIGESEDYGILSRMKNSPMLREPATELLRQVEEAVRAFATDPERIRKMISYVYRSSEYRRYAVDRLRAAGPDAVPLLIAELERLPEGRERSLLLQAMSRLSDTAIPPLLAVLDSRKWTLVNDVLYVLGQIGNAYTARVLRYYAEADTVPEAVHVGARRAVEAILNRRYRALPAAYKDLVKLAGHHFDHEHVWFREPDGSVRLWYWSDNEGLQARRVSTEYADLYLTVRFARQAYELHGASAEARALLVAAALQLVRLADASDPLAADQPDVMGPVSAAALAGDEALAGALELALSRQRIDLAETIVRVWSEVSRPSSLFRSPRLREVLHEALYWPDPGLRLAALELILRAKPARPFPGASSAVDMLRPFLAGTGQAGRWYVLAADEARAEPVAKVLRESGRPVTVVTSVGGLRDSGVSARTAAIVLVTPLPEPTADVVARLRLDPVLSVAPVVALMPAGELPRWSHLETDYPGTVVSRTPRDGNELAQLDQRLATLRRVVDDQRAQQFAQRAVGWLVQIARGELPALSASGARDALLAALRDPLVGEAAIEAAGYLPDAQAQAALLALTADGSAPVPLRVAAARAARLSVRRHGQLISPVAVTQVSELLREQISDVALYRELVLLAATLGGDRSLQREVILRFSVPRYRNRSDRGAPAGAQAAP